MTFTVKATIAVIRNDQLRPRCFIIAPVARHQIIPPMPLPEEATELANALRRVNHCGTIPDPPVNINPLPKPKRIPWQRYRCHTRVAKLAEIRPISSSTAPVRRVGVSPKLRWNFMTTGEIKEVIDIASPPTKA